MSSLNNKIIDSMYCLDNTKVIKVQHVKQAIEKEREDLRAIIWELAKEHGGSVLHYNDRIDDIHLKRFGRFEK